jgi:acetyltransferase-like isoleucine patch superfamily enzyme
MTESLADDLRSLHEALSADVRERWNRDLPLIELLSDRWDRARSLGFGEGSSIYASSYVYGALEVGRNVWIGPLTLLDGTGGLRIGDHSTISAGTHIYTHDTVARTLSGGQAEIERSEVVIGSRVYVGAGCVVNRGVTVGDMSVVGAKSFVNRSIPPRTIAFGVPARSVGQVVVGEDGRISLSYD